jgi:hypothetical protein
VIALAASLVLALYIAVPGLLFRSIYRLFIPLRIVVGTTTEQATRAVITTIFPFVLALLIAWYVPPLDNFPVRADHPELRVADYRLIASCLYSDQQFAAAGQSFWDALDRTWHRQIVFLFWYYLLTAAVGLIFGYLAGGYGKFKSNQYYRWFADKFLFSRISEWHPLLTPFVFADKDTVVRANILTVSDNLYRGIVSEHFADGDGKLTGIILTEAVRFDRRSFLQDKDAMRSAETEAYWKEVPGDKLYVFADKIIDLNLNYESSDPPDDVLERFLSRRLDVAVRIEYSTPTRVPRKHRSQK